MRRPDPPAPGQSRSSKRSHLTWRAIRWRLSSSIAFFLVAVVGIAAAAAGPLYLNAADHSIVDTALSEAPAQSTGIAINPYAGVTDSIQRLLAAGASVPGGGGNSPTDRFGPDIITWNILANFYSPVAGGLDTVALVSRTNACANLHMVVGHCPSGPNENDEVVLSTRSAVQLHAHVGSTLNPIPARAPKSNSGGSGPSLTFPALSQLLLSSSAPKLFVSGLYAPTNPNSPAWWGWNFMAYGAKGIGPGAIEQLDAGFISPSAGALYGSYLPSVYWVQLPLRESLVTPANAAAVVAELENWTGRTASAYQVTIGTNLPTVLNGALGQESLARTVVLLVSLQLVLLALLVLFAVAKATSDTRAVDVRVAELRGLPRGSVIRLVMREPFILLLTAIPAGLVVAWLIVTALSATLLGTGAPGLTEFTVLAAIGAFAAGVAASGFGSYGLMRSGFTQESLEIAVRSRSRNAAMVDALGIALAAGAVAELLANRGNGQSSGSDPLALAGPALLALGVGIIGSRLLPLVARSLTRLTRRTPHVSLGLAVRSIARRLTLARRVTVPAIAAGLLVFSISGLLVSQRNYQMQAVFTTGATDVMSVQVRPGVNFVQAVRNADRGSQPAMAAASVTAPYGQMLAVDSKELGRVVPWPAGLGPDSVSRIAQELAPKEPGTPSYIGNANQMAITADLMTPINPPIDLQFTIFDEKTSDQVSIDFGNLRSGLHRYTQSIEGFCPSSCRLDGFTLFWRPGAKKSGDYYGAQIRFANIEAGNSPAALAPVAAELTDTGAWKNSGPVSLVARPDGLTATANVATSAIPGIVPNDIPTPAPAVVTPGFTSVNANPLQPDLYQSVGLDGSLVNIRGASTVSVLPGGGSIGVLMDLSLAQLLQTHVPQGVQDEIWSTAPPSAALTNRLSRAGITITGTHLSATILKALKKSGPSLGYDLFSISAIGGLLLAAAALLFSITASARQRALELVGLSAAGLKRRPLGRSVLFESLMISLTGALFGFVAGVVGAALALPSLPEFGPGRVGPPLQLGLPWLEVILSGVVIVAVLVATSLAAAGLVSRWIQPTQLRMQP